MFKVTFTSLFGGGVQLLLLGQGLHIIEASRSHSGLLWTSDQPVADTSTWQHTTFLRDSAGFELTIKKHFALQWCSVLVFRATCQDVHVRCWMYSRRRVHSRAQLWLWSRQATNCIEKLSTLGARNIRGGTDTCEFALRYSRRRPPDTGVFRCWSSVSIGPEVEHPRHLRIPEHRSASSQWISHTVCLGTRALEKVTRYCMRIEKIPSEDRGQTSLTRNWIHDTARWTHLAARRSLSYTCGTWNYEVWMVWSFDTFRLLLVTYRSENNGSGTYCIRYSTYLSTGHQAMGILRSNIGSSFTCAYRDAHGNIEDGTNIVCTCTYIRRNSNAELVSNVDKEICFGVETLRSLAVWSQLIGLTDKTLTKLWFLV